jgi:hypothetical protein
MLRIQLTSFVRGDYLKRALHAVNGDPRLNFWRVIYGTMLDMAIIDWCFYPRALFWS